MGPPFGNSFFRESLLPCKHIPILLGGCIALLKITFMGAGSTVFDRNVLGDVISTPAIPE